MIRVLHVTDTHLSPSATPAVPPASFSDAVHALSGRTTDEATALVLDHAVGTRDVDLLLHTGDVFDEASPEAYTAGARVFTSLGLPLLVTPGNHDDGGLLASAFALPNAGGCSHLDLGAWRVVVACTARPGEQGGTFGPAVLDELDEVLAVDRPVLIGVHHPPRSPCPDPDCTITDAADFLATIARHPNVVAVASGHVHLADEVEHDGVRFLLTPSTAMQLVHEHPLPDHNREPTPIGARVIELHDDGTLATEVLWAPIADA